MTPQALLETAILMGLFVLGGGGYASLYSLGRLQHRRGMIWCAALCWLFAMGCALLIALMSPLDPGWKLLVLASALVYVVIPPVTWRYLQGLHAEEEHHA